MEKKSFFLRLLTLSLMCLTMNTFAAINKHPIILAPQPTACITAAFTDNNPSQYWHNISLSLTNNCGVSVDFQNATISFNSADNLNTNFWGSFAPLTYPDNTLQITSQPASTGGYIASLSLHFPEQSWANSILPNSKSITIQYGAPFASYDPNSVVVYLNGTPVQTGEIDLTNTTAQPSGISQSFALIDIMANGQVMSKVQLPWSGQQQIPGLTPGNYSIQPENVSDSQGNVYQGTASPVTVTVSTNQKVNSFISYTKITTFGSINVQAPPLPNVLAGYLNNPSIVLTQANTGGTTTQTVPWNTTSNIGQLANNTIYNLSTPMISFNNNQCTGSFNPPSLTSSANTPPTTHLSYNCVPVAQDKVSLSVNGLPSAITSVNVVFTPNNGSTPVTQNVSISSGTGAGTVNLVDGVVFQVSATPVSGYSASFNPQPLTATAGASETISYQKQTGGRIIGYLPGWKTPPSATSLANAGYTHILVAFGVFSTTQPGQIVSAFSTVTQSYIAALHSAGIKVSLSLGGASTSISGTSVDFHGVLSQASSPTAFQQTFVQSVENLITQYGFDGIDIDIEHGLNASGTFSQPTGDIAVLANIINQLHSDLPNLLISLAPQVDNIAATSGFSDPWGNYASLVMQTHNALSWVGIQLYNTGCAYGIDNFCYDPNTVQSPNFSTAMATDLLANWPATDPSGRSTGFQPYISYLNPSQVVIGYPAPNSAGQSDGAPVTPSSTIKRAIQCLRTAVAGANSCDTYVPPKAYPGIGGVFNWEVTYDQDNQFLFATSLKACVIGGTC